MTRRLAKSSPSMEALGVSPSHVNRSACLEEIGLHLATRGAGLRGLLFRSDLTLAALGEPPRTHSRPTGSTLLYAKMAAPADPL